VLLNRFYLNDKNFLEKLDRDLQKEKYARIVALTNDEEPLEEIQGKVTGGNISLDGSSAVRRTCNLTIVSQDVNINNFYWGLNTKFKLEIGFKNKIEPKYPDMIWFPQGTYIITSFSESIQTNNHTISISGKDKMVLLNGEVGGHITSLTWDFGTIEETQDDGSVIKKDVKLEDIIRDAVHEFAKEPLGNIMVDLDASGYNLLKYNGTEAIYFLVKAYGDSLDPDEIVSYNIGGEDYISFNNKLIKYKELEDENNKGAYYSAIDAYVTDLDYGLFKEQASKVKMVKPIYKECEEGFKYEKDKFYYKENDKYILSTSENRYEGRQYYIRTTLYENDGDTEYVVWKVDPGNPVGYEETDLVYAHKSDSDGLIMSVGETITAMLDKIVNQLGDYEYFYDVNGIFRFQRKKIYINSTFNNIEKTVDGEVIIKDNAQSSSFTYTFEGNGLVSSFQNTPDLLNLRNDYSIWGKRITASGAELPIHLRYAIDKKPEYYKNLNGKIYGTDEKIVKDILMNQLKGNISLIKRDLIEEERQRLKAYYGDNNYEKVIEIIEEEIKQETLERNPNPNGLPNDWWEVTVWAEYYQKLSGSSEPPQGQLRLYNTEIPPKEFNANMYFPKPEIGNTYLDTNNTNLNTTFVYNNSISYFGDWTKRGYSVNIFDVNSDGTLGYFGHGTGCTHSYTHFLNLSQQGIKCYFYKPQLPALNSENTYVFKKAQHKIINLISRDLNLYIKNRLDSDLEVRVNTMFEELLKEVIICDWREVLFQMAVDYRANYYNNAKYSDMMQYMNGKDADGNWIYPKGRTQYEQYYTDIISFWRELYCPKNHYYPISSGLTKRDFPYCSERKVNKLTYKKETYYYLKNGILIWTGNNAYNENRKYYQIYDGFFTEVKITEDNYEPSKYYFKRTSASGKDYYVFDSNNFFNSKLQYYSYNNQYFYRIKRENEAVYTYLPAIAYDANKTYYGFFDGEANEYYTENGWTPKIKEAPETLNFWFDFLDDDANMQKYSVRAIGDRTKALNDDDVRAIYFREVPRVVFDGDEESENEPNTGSAYIRFVSSEYLENLFTVSSQGKSAIDSLTLNFYNYSYCVESVNITSVPVYYLEPNTRVFMYDQETGINGEYLINKISLPLEYNGNMSLSAVKAPKRLF